MFLHDYFQQTDSQFDLESRMVWSVAHTPGYHTQIANGTRCRQTRGTMDYALALLQSGEAWRAQRACDIVEAIAALQVTDSLAQHYGIWGWFFEEPPEQMNPADWNWADFIGSRLAQMLAQHAGQMRDTTRDAARTALRHAALSIFRRNVNAGYTNIAIMGGVVTVAAGELLNMPYLLDYGRRRLASVKELADRTGGFGEYNSPTYTRVALEESERCLMLVQDAGVREIAEGLRVLAWSTIAERFHPGTGQMAGPNSRAYSDRPKPGFCRYLREQTGAAIFPHPQEGREMNLAGEELVDLVRPLPCPPAIAERFKRLPQVPLEVVTRFRCDPQGDIVGTTWLEAEACLGSVSRGHGWEQQRGLIGYWKTPEDPAVVLRARLLKSGVDFAASSQRNAQHGPRTLSSWAFYGAAGPFHPLFDKPAGNVHELADLRLRVSLRGCGVRVEELWGGRFALSAGGWRAVVHTAPGAMGETPIRWESGTEGDVAFVDAVLHTGGAKRFDFNTQTLVLAYGLELLRSGEAASAATLRGEERDDGERLWRWAGLELQGPTRPGVFTL
jgi:hypothetical protein